MKNVTKLFTMVSMALVSEGYATDYLAMDTEDIAKQGNWAYFVNGDMELGATDSETPGYAIKSWFDKVEGVKFPSNLYVPLTRSSGTNKYLEVPGYKGMADWQLYVSNEMYFPVDGQVTVSFKYKKVPNWNGEQTPYLGITISNECCNLEAGAYDPVSVRYPVRERKYFYADTVWSGTSYGFTVKKGMPHTFKFISNSRFLGEPRSGFCLDDLRIAYTPNSPNPGKEAVIQSGVEFNNLPKDVASTLSVAAWLPDAGATTTLDLKIRSDYFLDLVDTKTVTMNRGAADSFNRYLYSGSVSYTPPRYGSFNTLVMSGTTPVNTSGGDFTVLHSLNATPGVMRKRMGGHFRPTGLSFASCPGNPYPVFIQGGSISREANLYALSGLGHAMVPFFHKKVQPMPDTSDFSVADMEITSLENHGIEPIAGLGGWWMFVSRVDVSGTGTWVSDQPDWFYDDTYTTISRTEADCGRPNARYVNTTPWEAHVSGALTTFGANGRITKWMLPTEPQWTLKPEHYKDKLVEAYTLIKQANPANKVIGGDGTSDAGNQIVTWVQSLKDWSSLGYMDYVSFNPYGAGLDSIKGKLNSHSELVRKVDAVVDPKPLWQQELYYIDNSKRTQSALRQDVFSAGDVQRHYLLGFLNGLEGITGINNGCLVKKKYTGSFESGSDILAGLNTLAHFLDAATSVQTIHTPLSFLRCGAFSNDSGSVCTGVIWSMEPEQSITMTVPLVSGVYWYDCFGNLLANQTSIALGLDPVYVSGNELQVNGMFAAATFASNNGIAPASTISFKFDEGSGSTVAADTARITSGTASNSGWVTGVDGRAMCALSFSGSTSNVAIPSNSEFAVSATTGKVFSAWIKPSSYNSAGSNMIVNNRDGMTLRLNNGRAMFSMVDASGLGHYSVSSGTLPVGEWSHIAANYTVGIMKTYVNGKTVNGDAACASVKDGGNYALTVGRLWYNDNSSSFNGIIDHLQITDRGASDLEMRRLKDQAIIAYCFLLNDGNGTAVHDSFNSQLTGTVSNAVWTLNSLPKTLYFDGNGDKVTINGSNSAFRTDGEDGFTLAAWIMPDAAFRNGHNFVVQRGSTYMSIHRLNGYDRLMFCTTTGTGTRQYQSTNVQISPYDWHHIAAVFDSARKMHVYLDGVEYGTAGGPYPAQFNEALNLVIGDPSGENQGLKGNISNVRVYRRGLSGDEIKMLYDNRE